jgi:hypothetical protein
MSRALTWCWRHERIPWKNINLSSTLLRKLCAHYAKRVWYYITLKVFIYFIVTLYYKNNYSGWRRSEVLLALIGQFPKSRLHQWSELPQILVNPKMYHPTLLVQDEGVDYQHRDGPHDWKSLPKISNTLGSPIPVPLRVFHVAMYCNFSYRNYFAFSDVLCHVS